MLGYRISHWFYNRNLFKIANIIRSIGVTLNSADISPSASLGNNINLQHTVGVVIGNGVIIGDGVTIFQNVTLGTRDGKSLNYPIIGNNVNLFAGCIIAGSITIGDNSTIGANAVVLNDVPSDSIAVGIPATIKATKNK